MEYSFTLKIVFCTQVLHRLHLPSSFSLGAHLCISECSCSDPLGLQMLYLSKYLDVIAQFESSDDVKFPGSGHGSVPLVSKIERGRQHSTES